MLIPWTQSLLRPFTSEQGPGFLWTRVWLCCIHPSSKSSDGRTTPSLPVLVQTHVTNQTRLHKADRHTCCLPIAKVNIAGPSRMWEFGTSCDPSLSRGPLVLPRLSSACFRLFWISETGTAPNLGLVGQSRINEVSWITREQIQAKPERRLCPVNSDLWF